MTDGEYCLLVLLGYLAVQFTAWRLGWPIGRGRVLHRGRDCWYGGPHADPSCQYCDDEVPGAPLVPEARVVKR